MAVLIAGTLAPVGNPTAGAAEGDPVPSDSSIPEAPATQPVSELPEIPVDEEATSEPASVAETPAPTSVAPFELRVDAAPLQNSLTLEWSTPEPTDALVVYDTTSNYTNALVVSDPTEFQTVETFDLECNTEYHAGVVASSADGSAVRSADIALHTSPCSIAAENVAAASVLAYND
ncbi:MAG: hypothetical protein ACI8Y4_003679 [Candidatus Poriferisodalaceae bacterium]|jgi:hypothetical protein